jgi:hypothetical protein
MAADVLKRAQAAVWGIGVAHDQYPVRSAPILEVVARLRDVVEHAGDLPHSRPHPFDFERREGRRVVALGRHQGRAFRRDADRVLVAGAGRVAGSQLHAPGP